MTEDPDGCPRDGASRRKSLRRRIQTDVPETEDPDGSLRDGRPGRTGTENVPEMEGQDGWAHYLGFPSQGHPCVPSALALRLETDAPETDDRDGGPRLMPQADVPEA